MSDSGNTGKSECKLIKQSKLNSKTRVKKGGN